MDYRKTTSSFNKKLTSNELKLRKYTKRVTENKNNKPNSEMNNMMKQRHNAVYHKSAFSLSVNMEDDEKIPEETPTETRTMCRICQSLDDSLENQQVTPCGCSGSLQFVHLDCLRQWRLTKKAKGADISCCELCKQPYNVQLLGETDVYIDNLAKMQEDLRQLVKSGIYLMLLVKSWKTDALRLAQPQMTDPIQDHDDEINPTAVSERLTEHLQEIEDSTNGILSRNNLSSNQVTRPSHSGSYNFEASPTAVPHHPSSVDSSTSDEDDDYVTREDLKRRSKAARANKQ